MRVEFLLFSSHLAKSRAYIWGMEQIMETKNSTSRVRKPKVCKKCERCKSEIAKREEILEGHESNAAGYVSTRILCEKYRKLLAEHISGWHSEEQGGVA